MLLKLMIKFVFPIFEHLFKENMIQNLNLFKVDTIIKYRGCGMNKETLVKWEGWPKKSNSWIPASDLITYPPKK